MCAANPNLKYQEILQSFGEDKDTKAFKQKIEQRTLQLDDIKELVEGKIMGSTSARNGNFESLISLHDKEYTVFFRIISKNPPQFLEFDCLTPQFPQSNLKRDDFDTYSDTYTMKIKGKESLALLIVSFKIHSFWKVISYSIDMQNMMLAQIETLNLWKKSFYYDPHKVRDQILKLNSVPVCNMVYDRGNLKHSIEFDKQPLIGQSISLMTYDLS